MKIYKVKLIFAVEICVVLTFYAAQSGSSIPTFRDNLSIPPSRVKQSNTLEDGIGCPRNIGGKLPFYAA
jgi:hypothetical protein